MAFVFDWYGNYRLYKVDLVVIYIQSVDLKVYRLMKYYKSDGLVQFRHSLRMPEKLLTLNYNPNAETTWNNQLINFNDCLYEFRESADFIAFPDWDELIVTEQMKPLANIFQEIVNEIPNAASFLFERTTGSMQKLENMKSHKIYDIWRNSVRYHTIVLLPSRKLVVRPMLTDGLQIHLAAAWKQGFVQYIIPLNKTFMIHARDHTEWKEISG
uniref:Glycosyltransferase family 92 protein n=1 Tax=Ditylenchus dipsaci TaxID=166011 RepID=A0A915ED63_9BILA